MTFELKADNHPVDKRRIINTSFCASYLTELYNVQNYQFNHTYNLNSRLVFLLLPEGSPIANLNKLGRFDIKTLQFQTKNRTY